MDKCLGDGSILYLGDCTEKLKLIQTGSIDLVVTDPPYDLANMSDMDNGYYHSLPHYKEMESFATGYDIREIGEELLRVMKSPEMYIWCNKLQIPDYFDFYVKENGLRFDILCWHKPNVPPYFSNKYLSDTEYCLHFFGGEGKCFPTDYDSAKTFWVEPMNVEDKKYYNHPTIKPQNMIAQLVANSSKEGDTVLDCFMGSGTTGAASVLQGRKFVGIELDKKFYEIATSRVETALLHRKSALGEDVVEQDLTMAQLFAPDNSDAVGDADGEEW